MAKASGYLLDPMPEGYVSVRSVYKKANRNIYATVFSILDHIGVSSVSNKDFEAYVDVVGAKKLLAFLTKEG